MWRRVPYVFFLHHYPRLGAEEAGNLETPMGRPKHPTKTVSLAKGPGEDLPAGQEPDRPNRPIQPDPSLPPSNDVGWGSLASHSLWAVTTPSPFPPAMQSQGEQAGSLDFHPPWRYPGACPLPTAGVTGGRHPAVPVEAREPGRAPPSGSDEAASPLPNRGLGEKAS